MKLSILFMAIIAIFFRACDNSNTTSTKTEIKNTTMDSVSVIPKVAEVFACPMHPEVTGKKGEKCPKCEMELTVPVK